MNSFFAPFSPLICLPEGHTLLLFFFLISNYFLLTHGRYGVSYMNRVFGHAVAYLLSFPFLCRVFLISLLFFYTIWR